MTQPGCSVFTGQGLRANSREALAMSERGRVRRTYSFLGLTTEPAPGRSSILGALSLL